MSTCCSFDEKEELTGAIINVPCPSQNTENEYYLSADYWNDVRIAIRKKYGDIYLLPQARRRAIWRRAFLHYKRAQDRRFRLKYGESFAKKGLERTARQIAERIAAAFDEVCTGPARRKSGSAHHHVVETVQLSKRLISDEEYAYDKQGYAQEMAKEYRTDGDPQERLFQNSVLYSLRNRYKGIIDRYEAQRNSSSFPWNCM